MLDPPLKPESWHVQRLPSGADARRSSQADYTTIYPSGDELAGDIDLREEIAGILSRRGHYVFLRRSQDRRCGCWRPTFREADINCPYCTGTGWMYRDELHLARRMPVTDPTVAALLERRRRFGFHGSSQFIFWFGHDVDPGPSRRDTILEVKLDPNTGMPTKGYVIEAQWSIGQVHSFRDKGGRIEYWACWVREGSLGKE
jgi:hypothetical protein